MSTADNPVDFDVLICGGGLVGASLALMLQPLGLRVALLEATPFKDSGHPSFDERTTALSNGSRRIFDAIGVWPLLERAVTPIKRIHVSDRGRFGFARLVAAEQGLSALGHVIPNWQMGAALWQRLQATGTTLLAPCQVLGSRDEGAVRSVRVLHADTEREWRARLVVAADGAQSLLRADAGIDHTQWDYGQTAIISNALTQQFHDYCAYERFTADGPLAALPLSDARVGLIWMQPHARAKAIMEWSDAQFLREFQTQFGLRLGKFLKVGARHAYPLALIRADAQQRARLALMGNAAQMLHPIAGQGLNLGLRDAASLAELLADARRANAQADVGGASLLGAYHDWRHEDSQRIVAFTDGLVRVFNQPFAPIKALRDLGLLAFDLMPSAKQAMAQLSFGASSRVPRLARGAPL